MALNGGFEYREQIAARDAGCTVLSHLSRKYRHSTRETWEERLRQGEIFLDDLPVNRDCPLKAGQRLSWRRPPWHEPEVPLFYKVLCRDEELLVVEKPSGLPTVPAGGYLDHTLLALVRKGHPQAVPVHRLGRGTSGIVLFALSPAARSSLSEAFRNRAVTKVYRALVRGNPTRDCFEVHVPIGPVFHPRLGTVHAACPGGREALSRVRILDRRDGESLVEVTIETGRPHQIRIHMAAFGHPLVGDPLYTHGGLPAGTGKALPGDAGYLLHAESLSLRHPATGSAVRFYCSPPPELL